MGPESDCLGSNPGFVPHQVCDLEKLTVLNLSEPQLPNL